MGTVTAQGLGDGLWRTFSGPKPLPLTTAEARDAGWKTAGSCVPGLGNLYTKSGHDLPNEDAPLGMFFSNAGQVSGLRVDIFGDSWTSGVGNAAQAALIKRGFWRVETGDSKHWFLTVGFRDPSVACSSVSEPGVNVGDRVVVNPDSGLNVSIPLTATEARDEGYAPGSCMETMGQHHFLDLNLRGGKQGWVEGDLQPIVPMYTPVPVSSASTLHAIFFTTRTFTVCGARDASCSGTH